MVHQRIENLLLKKLPQPYLDSLLPRLEEVTLPAGAVLYEAEEAPRYAWFITSGLVSKMVSMSDGRSAEVGMCGNEGVVPAWHLLGGMSHGPTRCVVQVELKALRMPFPELKEEMERSPALRRLVQRCVHRRSMILSQVAACNRLHGAEERLARWLLTAQDLTGNSNVMLSQGFLADILGSRRTTVTLAAGALRRQKLISYRRGQIQILDHRRLEEAACECYETVSQLFEDFYG
ncbi:MAG TPA: Crp/Fnr family transcriptional regulator [Acidobacteriaceae bacterium]|nr:Crp/Fnr family transcriptional regulator [Acidobacteriaceae bacterium]